MFTVGVITLLATATATCTPPCSPEIYRSFNLTSRATLGKGLDWILGTTTTTTTTTSTTLHTNHTKLNRSIFFEQYYEKKPLAIQRDPSLPNYYGDLFPFTAVSEVIDNFPDQRKLDDWVIVNENFVTSSTWQKLPQYVSDPYIL